MAAQRPGTPQTLDGQVYWFDPEVKEDLLRRGMLNQINEFLHRMNATVELFLATRVTCIVSDEVYRLSHDPHWPANLVAESPLPGVPQRRHDDLATPSPATPIATPAASAQVMQLRNVAAPQKKLGEDAMLKNNLDVLKHAKANRAKVITTDQLVKLLESYGYSRDVGSRDRRPAGPSTPTRAARDDNEYIVLVHPHIIIEDTTKRHRSFYKEFPPDSHGRSTLPCINFNAPPGTCPFFPPSVVEERARYQEQQRLKKRSKLQTKLAEFLKKTPEEQMLICRRAGPPEGYCECCQVKYSDINAHTSSAQHRAFATDASNYKVLDEMFARIKREAHLPRAPVLDILPQEEFLELERANFLKEMAAAAAASASASSLPLPEDDDAIPLFGPAAFPTAAPAVPAAAAAPVSTAAPAAAASTAARAGEMMAVDSPMDVIGAAAQHAMDAEAEADAAVVETEVATMELVAPGSPVAQVQAQAITPPPRRPTTPRASSLATAVRTSGKRERNNDAQTPAHTPAPAPRKASVAAAATAKPAKEREMLTPPATVQGVARPAAMPARWDYVVSTTPSAPTPSAPTPFEFEPDLEPASKRSRVSPDTASKKAAGKGGRAKDSHYHQQQPQPLASPGTGTGTGTGSDDQADKHFSPFTANGMKTKPLPTTYAADRVMAGPSALTTPTGLKRKLMPVNFDTPSPSPAASRFAVQGQRKL